MVAGIRCDPSNSRDKIFCKMKFPKIHSLPINSSIKRGGAKRQKRKSGIRNDSESSQSKSFLSVIFGIGTASLDVRL